MSRYAYTATSGLVAASEVEVIVHPRTASDGASKRGVILCHGAGALETEFTNPANPGSFGLLHLLGSLGFYVVIADLGGAGTFGNDTVVSRMTAAWNLLKTVGCKTDKAICGGVSMGGMSCANAARAAAVPMSGYFGIIPFSDLADGVDNNRLSLANSMCDAWSLAHGTPSSGFPSRANPNTTTNAALIAASCPNVYLSYSSGDTAIPPSTVTSLASKLSTAGAVVTTNVHGSQDHSEGSVLDAITGNSLINLKSFIAAVA